MSRIGMRRGLAAGLALLVAVGALGCSDGDEDTATSTASGSDSGSGSGSEAGAGGGEPSSDDATAEGGWHGALVREPAARPDFTLTDTEGRPYDFGAETAGQLTLLFFGYTSCPDICPLHMAILTSALERPGMPDPVVVFVTTDPDRDTPEHLREWLDGFGADVVGLTGTPEEIHQAEAAAMVDPSFYADMDGNPVDAPDTDVNYEVGHAAQIVAYTSDDLTHIVYPYGVKREDWLADLPRLADGWPPAA